jgi:hypothetical protein
MKTTQKPNFSGYIDLRICSNAKLNSLLRAFGGRGRHVGEVTKGIHKSHRAVGKLRRSLTQMLADTAAQIHPSGPNARVQEGLHIGT